MAGRARAVPVQVTVKGRRKLVRIVRAGTSPQRLVLRAKIVLAAADGQANAQIARDLGCSVAVVRTWRGRFTVRGIPGLFDKRRSGRPGEFEYVRHGTVSVIAAMNVTTGEVIAERIARNDSATFISFLSLLDQSIPPGLDIHLIMDNGSSRTSRAWLAAHPGITVTYAPKHASWLNMIEQWSGVLTRKLLRRGDFTSREDLETRITAFTIRHNKRARPYKWSYDADAEHARYLERHPQPEPQTALPEAA